MEYGTHLSDHSDYCHDMEKRFFFQKNLLTIDAFSISVLGDFRRGQSLHRLSFRI